MYIHKKTGKKYKVLSTEHGLVKIESLETGNILFITENNFKTFYKKEK